MDGDSGGVVGERRTQGWVSGCWDTEGHLVGCLSCQNPRSGPTPVYTTLSIDLKKMLRIVSVFSLFVIASQSLEISPAFPLQRGHR